MENISFTGKDGTFTMERPENYSYLYFPVAGEGGIKSALTPNLGGDSKLNQNAFIMEPVSSENLHNNRSTRNFWCRVDGTGAWSVTGASADGGLYVADGYAEIREIPAGSEGDVLCADGA